MTLQQKLLKAMVGDGVVTGELLKIISILLKNNY
jgi:hypothetical protein